MALFLSYLGLIKSEVSLVDRLSQAERFYATGDFDKIENIFTTIQRDFPNNEKCQLDLVNYLLKTGQYQRIVEMNMLTNTAKNIQENAKNYLKILQSKNNKEIADLIEVSPSSFDVVIAAAKHSLEAGKNGNYGKFKLYLERAEKLSKTSTEPKKLLGQYNFLIGNIEEGFKIFESLQIVTRDYRNLYSAYNEYLRFGQAETRYYKLKELYMEVKKKVIMDNFIPSIYKSFELKVLEHLVQNGCDAKVSGKGLSSLAARLEQENPIENTRILNVKAHAVDGLFGKARSIFEGYKKRNEISSVTTKVLDTFILLMEKNEKDRKKQQERENERRERERREQYKRSQSNRQGSNKKGEDFLGYYKALNVTSAATPKELKKAHRAMTRKIGIGADKDKEKQEQLKKVNKAYQILSDEKTKQLYDSGVNPESPEGQNYNQRSDFQGGGYVVDEDINEIFKSFFGGGGRGGRGNGYQRTQFFYF